MIIESIKMNKNSADVFVDGKKYAKFSLDVLYKYNLKEGNEYEEERWREIADESEMLQAKEYAFTYLSTYMKCRKEAKQKLYFKGFHKKAVEYALDKAEEYGYINDERYAKTYLESHMKNKGLKVIKYELRSKGIDEKIIDELLQEISDEDEYAVVLKAASKYYWAKNGEIVKEKMYSHLAAKGFSYELIMKAMKAVGEDLDQ